MKSNIQTWPERCEKHPDHQSGMVTNVMIQRRMQEEIDDLRAENERLRAETARLRVALQWYAYQFCEFNDDFEGCRKIEADVCTGCKARDALTEQEET